MRCLFGNAFSTAASKDMMINGDTGGQRRKGAKDIIKKFASED
jgi:hypothetical protein